MSETVVIVGASPKPERYAHQAQTLLQHYGHKVVPVHPVHTVIDGVPVIATLAQVPVPVDTVTLYVGPEHSAGMTAELIALKPRRVIFNPGTESPVLEQTLRAAGIDTEQACTLVLLRTGQF